MQAIPPHTHHAATPTPVGTTTLSRMNNFLLKYYIPLENSRISSFDGVTLRVGAEEGGWAAAGLDATHSAASERVSSRLSNLNGHDMTH